MTANILVAYATKYGSTKELAFEVATALKNEGLSVEIKQYNEKFDLARYNAVVMGAPLYMYRWHKEARRFLKRYRKTLPLIPVAVFAVGPVQSPRNEKEFEGSHAQLDKILGRFTWFSPVSAEVFGGRLDPSKLGFPMKLFAGKIPASDIVDPEAARSWAKNIIPLLVK